MHSSQEYRVYAIGFAPGFAYLGEVDERIAAPRLRTPRTAYPGEPWRSPIARPPSTPPNRPAAGT
jgi:hypothetical protein